MYFILKYELSEDYLEKRAPLRKEHLDLIKNHQTKGLLKMAGAFEDSSLGALLIFQVDNKEVVENFVKADPYYIHGLIKSYNINKWNCVVNEEGMLV